MPELPEVEVLRRSLEPVLVGDRIERVEVRETRLREPVRRAQLARRVVGTSILRLDRRSKYLLIELSGGSSLVIHLGMSGRLTVVDAAAPLEPHEHVAFFLASGRRLRFRDPRRFGLVFALATHRREDSHHFEGLGPEPLTELFSGATLEAAAVGRRGPVKSFLMNNAVVVGVGNIYASESLFQAGIHPSRSVARISRQRWQALAVAAKEVLGRAIDQGGTTLNDFTDGTGHEGYFQVSLAVYDREGHPCPRCGSSVRRQVHAGRSTYFCPRCQR